MPLENPDRHAGKPVRSEALSDKPENRAIRLKQAEDKGLRIAIVCRTLAALAGLSWYVAAIVFTHQEVRLWALFGLLLFVSIGIAHLLVIETRFNRWWMKFLLYAFDALSICALFVVIPISRADEVPQIIAFRAYGIYYLFPLIALAALSLSWRLVLWTGAVSVVGWWSAFLWVVADMQNTLSWADIPADATREDYETIFLSIDFIGRGNRIEETGLLFVGAAILAVAVYRARQLFFAQLEADEERNREALERQKVTHAFGQYVPEVVVAQLTKTGGKLPQRQSQGAVLVLDIEGFSRLLVSGSPEVAIGRVDAFLADAADEIERCKGTVISYTGDGLLASFNAPLDLAKPELVAADVSMKLATIARQHDFKIRIGLAAGTLISGSIGSENRLSFTVYGEAVNRAARCEELCKKLNLRVLMDATFHGSISGRYQTKSVGKQEIRGISDAEQLFTFASEH